jgi:Cd2+/Zn2+-exporting ATPase
MVEELAGRGIRAVVDGRPVLAGNAKLLTEAGVSFKPEQEAGTVIYLAADNCYAGSILIEDELKADAPAALAALRAAGVKETVMLTGDSAAAGEKAAAGLGLDKVYTGLLPGDKVAKLEELLGNLQRQDSKAKLAFVGDGINDAPVLARADVGIAMGALGSDAAIEAADVVLMTDEPSKIAVAMQIARKTMGIAYQNIVFAIGVKLIILILGALGLASMWAAVFADVGVAFLAILNAMRALRVKPWVPAGASSVAAPEKIPESAAV